MPVTKQEDADWDAHYMYRVHAVNFVNLMTYGDPLKTRLCFIHCLMGKNRHIIDFVEQIVFVDDLRPDKEYSFTEPVPMQIMFKINLN